MEETVYTVSETWDFLMLGFWFGLFLGIAIAPTVRRLLRWAFDGIERLITKL